MCFPPSLLICLFSPTPSLLDSDDVFIIMDTKTRFVWKGTHSSEFAYDIAQVVQMNISFRFFSFINVCAQSIAKGLSAVASKTIIAQENLEPPTFWKILGGKKGFFLFLFLLFYSFLFPLQITFYIVFHLLVVRQSVSSQDCLFTQR